MSLLRFERLAASYAGQVIFMSASLELDAGVHALQGANGSGKSTLLRLLGGAHLPDEGEIWIDGVSLARSPEAARRRLSYVPDESPVYPFMTGKEFMQFVAAAKRADLGTPISDLAKDLGLLPHLGTRFGAMSLGTQKKMLLCAAWIGEPQVMLMDEPSNGLDEAARECLAVRLRAWGTRTAILCATHDADFVAATGASIVHFGDLFI